MKLVLAVALIAVAGSGCGASEQASTAGPSTTTTQAEAQVGDVEPIESGPSVGEDLLFVYTEGDQVWGVTLAGEPVTLNGIGTRPQLARDGRTIFYSRGEWPDIETVVLNVRTGDQRLLRGLGEGLHFGLASEITIFGSRAAVPTAEPGEPIALRVLASDTFELEKTIPLGRESIGKSYVALAWDTDGESLLAFTWDTESAHAWWRVDLRAETATLVNVGGVRHPGQHESFFLGDARVPGVFPALLEGWGGLRIADGFASFVPGQPPGPRAPGELSISRYWHLDGRAVKRGSDNRFTIDNAPEGGRLVSYWEMYRDDSAHLLYVGQDGRAETLLENVEWVDAA